MLCFREGQRIVVLATRYERDSIGEPSLLFLYTSDPRGLWRCTQHDILVEGIHPDDVRGSDRNLEHSDVLRKLAQLDSIATVLC